MLVMTRTVDEDIVIGHDIAIRVIRVVGGQVRIGIYAPKDTPIYRGEVYKAKYGKESPINRRHSGSGSTPLDERRSESDQSESRSTGSEGGGSGTET